MELAVAGQHPQAARIGARAGRGEADDEVMGVGGKHDRRRIAAAKLGRDLGLRRGPQLAHDPVPLAVGEARGIGPAFDLAVIAGVGP